MYLYLGQTTMVAHRDIIGIFDLDNTSWSHRTRRFLAQAQQTGTLVALGHDLPRSFLLCGDGRHSTVYMSQFNTATLIRRVEQDKLEQEERT